MKVAITKDQYGKLVGFGQAGAKTYEKFLQAVRALEPGEMLSFEYRVPRSQRFHGLHFAMLTAVFDNQEQWQDEYQFRKWTEAGAGHADIAPGPKGKPIAVVRSIAYDALDDEEFHVLHEAIKAFLRSEHAVRFLWPEVNVSLAMASMDQLIAEFER